MSKRSRSPPPPSHEIFDISDDDGDVTHGTKRAWDTHEDDLPRGKRTAEQEVRELASFVGLDVDGANGAPSAAVGSRRPHRVFVNSAPLAFEAQLQHLSLYSRHVDACAPATHAEMDYNPVFRVVESTGDETLKQFRAALESFGIDRTFLQVVMHDLALNVMGSCIYREEWKQHRQRILEANNWRDLLPLLAAICARRFGKSFGAGMLAAAAMLSVPGAAVGCFAPTLRQATAIMQTCWALLCKSSLFSQFKVIKLTATAIVLMGPDGQEVSLIAYPSTHKVCAVALLYRLSRRLPVRSSGKGWGGEKGSLATQVRRVDGSRSHVSRRQWSRGDGRYAAKRLASHLTQRLLHFANLGHEGPRRSVHCSVCHGTL